jgi:hypothetical protein
VVDLVPKRGALFVGVAEVRGIDIDFDPAAYCAAFD